MSDSLASTTGRASGRSMEQESHGKKKEAQPLGDIQGTSGDRAYLPQQPARFIVAARHPPLTNNSISIPGRAARLPTKGSVMESTQPICVFATGLGRAFGLDEEYPVSMRVELYGVDE
jgi:hypothetical protein